VSILDGEKVDVSVGIDYQLRAQVSAILKTNLEIVKMNAVLIKQLMQPPMFISGKLEDNELDPELLEELLTKEGDNK
jgi:hypothetical protein